MPELDGRLNFNHVRLRNLNRKRADFLINFFSSCLILMKNLLGNQNFGKRYALKKKTRFVPFCSVKRLDLQIRGNIELLKFDFFAGKSNSESIVVFLEFLSFFPQRVNSSKKTALWSKSSTKIHRINFSHRFSPKNKEHSQPTLSASKRLKPSPFNQ